MRNEERKRKIRKELIKIAEAAESIGELMQEVPKRRIERGTGTGQLDVARLDIEEDKSYVTIHSGPNHFDLDVTSEFYQSRNKYHLSISGRETTTK